MPPNTQIAAIVGGSGRRLTPGPPAAPDAIAELLSVAQFQLPNEYVELLGFCDGGHGELNAPPLYLEINSISEAIGYNQSEFRRNVFNEFWFFGGNGGLELVAFDLRQGPPWRIVMIDPIAGPSSAEIIAEDMADLLTKVGVPADVQL
jgi:hypothetical protein